MGATGRPASGARYVLERASETAERVVYSGFVHLPDADIPISVEVALPGGGTRAEVGEPELGRVAAALVRSATKSAVQAGRALPRKIVRWRGSAPSPSGRGPG